MAIHDQQEFEGKSGHADLEETNDDSQRESEVMVSLMHDPTSQMERAK